MIPIVAVNSWMGRIMGILYARAFTQQALLDAWEIVRDNALADGRFDPAVERFEADAARRIADIAAELAAGEWNPGALFRVEIPKTSGGVRRLSVPRLEDRVVERALLAVLDPVIDPRLLPWSFAYRKGLGTKDAVAELVSARDGGADWCARRHRGVFRSHSPLGGDAPVAGIGGRRAGGASGRAAAEPSRAG
ncbi:MULTISPECIES: reverse transcriptase family protein [Nocardia]|uniref:hypothetical protein n=1 Tax=Nocardia TaxID=1817 RepID=UPI000FDC9535|nr:MULTISPECIES: hypothetical protein [Nocardia]UEX20813.1 hypothetical protein LMJ57_17455 [Nocardia farcinica]